MNVFFVETPLQLLNAIEAKSLFKSKNKDVLIIYEIEENNAKQMKVLTSGWDLVFIIQGSSKHFIKILKINYIAKSLKKIENIFIGEDRSDLMSYFVNLNRSKCQNIFLLDDGTHTIVLFQELKKQELKYDNKEIKNNFKYSIKSRIINTIFAYNTNKFKYNFFSAFDPPKSFPTDITVIKNNYNFLKQKISTQKILSNTVYFLGQPLSEENILMEDFYFKYLNLIKKYYINNTFIYIPHRREKYLKIQKIQNEYGIIIKQFETSIEYSLSIESCIPEIIAGFYSTALITCKSIYGNKININSFTIDSQYTTELFNDYSIKLLYEYLQKMDIDMINLSLV